MLGGESMPSLTTIRRDVYRLFLALTRLVVDPLVAGQLPGALYQDQAGNSISGTE
jgi:hypothetical protein